MSGQDKKKILYMATHGPEDPERASFPFVLANAALAMDIEAVVALQGTAVWLACEGTVGHIFAGGLPPLKSLVDDFLELGGRLLVCTPCLKHRHIDPSQLIDKAEVVAAAVLTSEILSAKAVLNY